jgi:hypothetical protein
MVAKCKTDGCGSIAAFGVTKRTACAKHKTPDMVNLSNPKCSLHGRRKTECTICGGSQMCHHGVRRAFCQACLGSQICEHLKQKGDCLLCGGFRLCQCGTRSQPRYDGWCASCFHREYPDDPRSKNKNDAEFRLAQHLDQHSLVKSWSKTSVDCEGRQLIPDAVVEIEGGGTVMIELDGPQHMEVVPHFHPNGEEGLKSQIERDLLKNREARRRGWSLLRIGHPLYKRLEQEIDRFIDDFITGNRAQLFRATPMDLYNSIPRLV